MLRLLYLLCISVSNCCLCINNQCFLSMKNHKTEVLQQKSFTAQAQGVAQPPNKPQGKGKAPSSTAKTSAVVTALTQHLQKGRHQSRVHQHLLDNRLQCSCPPDPHWEGLALLTHKPDPFSFPNVFTATDWRIWGSSDFQNESPGAQTLQSAALSLTSQVGNTAHNI